jgi:hypothetical protein
MIGTGPQWGSMPDLRAWTGVGAAVGVCQIEEHGTDTESPVGIDVRLKGIQLDYLR